VEQATALAPGWLAVAVLVGQLTSDTLPQTVEMTHELGQGAGGAHGRALGADGFEQGENLKLLAVAQSLGVAHRCHPLGLPVGMIDQHARMGKMPSLTRSDPLTSYVSMAVSGPRPSPGTLCGCPR
jgi:hypothetical protein